MKTIVFNVNCNTITPEDKILSVASCTTNCLAPMAKAIGLVIPELQGKLKGHAQRVPTLTGSVTELVSILEKKVTEVGDVQLVKTVAWYDNEYGFVTQLVRVLDAVAKE